ncbi:MAG: hypothetical protein HOP37_00145 [Cyclobacteriaceae bacterium]|nr:hypothetical protein [Cyclobacteriaceae bacterium]
MKNLLKLHEAIAVVLLNKPKRTANTEEIAKEINKRGLYKRKDGKPLPAYQIMMRSKLNNGRYAYQFEYLKGDRVKLG